jgi:hypothetical protein
MTPSKLFDIATDQLDRVLGFFERADKKSSFVFVFDTGLVAILSLNFHATDLFLWYVTLPLGLAALLIGASLYCVYRSSFPNLKGGNGSLFYFREIADRTEANFITEFTASNETGLAADILGQVWRNSEILREKYDFLKYAFRLSAFALAPWCVFLAITSALHGQPIILK